MCRPVILELWRERSQYQEIEFILGYTWDSRPAWTTSETRSQKTNKSHVYTFSYLLRLFRSYRLPLYRFERTSSHKCLSDGLKVWPAVSTDMSRNRCFVNSKANYSNVRLTFKRTYVYLWMSLFVLTDSALGCLPSELADETLLKLAHGVWPMRADYFFKGASEY